MDIVMQLLVPFIVTVIITLVLGKFGIGWLRSLHAQQSIREEGPKGHQVKAGTPTMGGLFMLLALVVGLVIFAEWNAATIALLILTLGHGLLGFFDDFVKSVKKRNLGLTAKQKLLGQFILAAIFLYIMTHYLDVSTSLWIPVVGAHIDLGWFYYVLAFLIIVGSTNAVNLTDGLDGLAAGTSAIAAIAFAVLGIILGYADITTFAVLVSAICMGFLFYNAHPAKVFMGDTGSLALGAAFAGMAIMMKAELLLVIIGGIFVMEALSVIIQVISFKTRGVRVFKMSPIHHHFELSGWKETKVVSRFWFAGAILAIVGILLAMV
ncbi:MAG: phospho-N-acetylmuramoyl-pentapeptide-transferase [Veillonella sp.]|nr:phospho-N-acetylmuramoyl-pentapeptide-transferase [Veillonella sp.]